MLNIAALKQATLKTQPYPYFVLSDSLEAGSLADVLRDFPSIEVGGSIPISATRAGAAFLQLIEELNSNEFRQIIADKFSIKLEDNPIVTTVRGVMRKKDGRIHTDSKSKVITILIYFNENWSADGGRLRILESSDDINNYVEEVTPLAGTMVAFQVTDNCWHGHTPIEGKRLSLQMNYLVSGAAQSKHQLLHRLSAKLKPLLLRLVGKR